MTVLLVAGTGGHLSQLHRLAPRIAGVDENSVWVTFDAPQSRSLLQDRNVVFVPYSGPRDLVTALKNSRHAVGIIRRTKPSLVVSTGNAIAVSFLPVARMAGIASAYIESAARADGPSLTGRILWHVPGVKLYSQYADWGSPRWEYVGSVFDPYVAMQSTAPKTIRRVLVTIGTITYGFRRLIERVLKIVPADCEVVWQVGVTDVSGLGIESHATMLTHALQSEIHRADVVIAHAGIGSALAALEAGRAPVLVPRERSHGEHVDDHQKQIATRLDSLGLATYRTVDELTREDLIRAAGRSVVRRPGLPDIMIGAGEPRGSSPRRRNGPWTTALRHGPASGRGSDPFPSFPMAETTEPLIADRFAAVTAASDADESAIDHP